LSFRRFRAPALAVILSLMSPALAADAGDYAPENLARTYGRMKWLCIVPSFCPYNDNVRDVITGALANDRSAEYMLGLTLLTGDGLPSDRNAGVRWVARAAELGEPAAAMDIAGRLRNGASIDVDETKIAEALRPQASAGHVEAMRALAPMYINGRGVKQDPSAGLSLLLHAAQMGSSDAESDLSQLYLDGAPGVPVNRPEAMKWLATSARHGNVQAMLNLGYMSLTAMIIPRNVVDGYCWLMRAALLDQVQAQEKLSMVFAEGEKDNAGAAIPIDLVQADLWFRLAARSPYHDNSQIRAMIEPHMTTEQIDQAKRLFEAWRPVTLPELKTRTISLPGGSASNCPPMT
jgi:TPR repeat protein